MKEKRLNEIKTIAVKRRMVEEKFTVEEHNSYVFNYLQDIEFIEKELSLHGSLNIDYEDMFC